MIASPETSGECLDPSTGRVVATMHVDEFGYTELYGARSGVNHGQATRVDPTGRVVWQRAYVEGVPHGTWYTYNDSGRIEHIAQYHLGAPVGMEVTFSEQGEVLRLLVFKDRDIYTSLSYISRGEQRVFVTYDDDGAAVDFVVSDAATGERVCHASRSTFRSPWVYTSGTCASVESTMLSAARTAR